MNNLGWIKNNKNNLRKNETGVKIIYKKVKDWARVYKNKISRIKGQLTSEQMLSIN